VARWLARQPVMALPLGAVLEGDRPRSGRLVGCLLALAGRQFVVVGLAGPLRGLTRARAWASAHWQRSAQLQPQRSETQRCRRSCQVWKAALCNDPEGLRKGWIVVEGSWLPSQDFPGCCLGLEPGSAGAGRRWPKAAAKLWASRRRWWRSGGQQAGLQVAGRSSLLSGPDLSH